jgi:hypothetical protein
MLNEVTIHEVIGVWLKREFGVPQWDEYIKPIAKKYVPHLTKAEIKETLIDNQNYESEDANKLRFHLLTYRRPLLMDIHKARWVKKTLSENEFKNLQVIKSSGWSPLSNYTGKISIVAETIHCTEGLPTELEKLKERIHATLEIEQSGNINTNLILLQSDNSTGLTIIEGNKNAVALYIKLYLKNEGSYQQFNVYLGYLKQKCRWQW